MVLGQQRYYDVMCLVLGSDPETYGPILTPAMAVIAGIEAKSDQPFDDETRSDWLDKTDALNILPHARASGCAEEYQEYTASWDFLIQNFMTPQ